MFIKFKKINNKAKEKWPKVDIRRVREKEREGNGEKEEGRGIQKLLF